MAAKVKTLEQPELEVALAVNRDRTSSTATMDDFAKVQFSFIIFLYELFIHLIGPFAIPFVWWKEGHFGLHNRLLTVNIRAMIFGHGGFIGFWLCLWAWFAYPMPHVSTAEVFVAGAVYQARNVIISLKYAFMSPQATLDRCSRKWSAEEITATLMVPGWWQLNAAAVNRELRYAARRLGININTIFFSFSRDEELGESYLRTASLLNQIEGFKDDEDWARALQAGKAPGWLYLPHLIASASRPNISVSKSKWMMFILTLIHIFIPTVIRGVKGQLGQLTWPEWIVVVLTAIICLPNLNANLSFVFIGVVDYIRRFNLMQACAAMISNNHELSQLGLPIDIKFQVPEINYQCPVNMWHWHQARRLFKDFGKQYFVRIQSYSSLWLLIVLAYAFFFIGSSLTSRKVDITAAVLGLYDMTLLLVLLGLMLYTAQRLNKQHATHIDLLVHKQVLITRTLMFAKYHGKMSGYRTNHDNLVSPLDGKLDDLEEYDDDHRFGAHTPASKLMGGGGVPNMIMSPDMISELAGPIGGGEHDALLVTRGPTPLELGAGGGAGGSLVEMHNHAQQMSRHSTRTGGGSFLNSWKSFPASPNPTTTSTAKLTRKGRSSSMVGPLHVVGSAGGAGAGAGYSDSEISSHPPAWTAETEGREGGEKEGHHQQQQQQRRGSRTAASESGTKMGSPSIAERERIIGPGKGTPSLHGHHDPSQPQQQPGSRGTPSLHSVAGPSHLHLQTESPEIKHNNNGHSERTSPSSSNSGSHHPLKQPHPPAGSRASAHDALKPLPASACAQGLANAMNPGPKKSVNHAHNNNNTDQNNLNKGSNKFATTYQIESDAIDRLRTDVLDPRVLGALADSRGMMEFTINYLQRDDVLHPVQILGFSANLNFLRAFISLAAALLGTAGRFLFAH